VPFQLSELKHLDLSRFQCLLTMPIVKLADPLQLTYLKFGKVKHTVPRYEQAVLLDLEIALSKQELKLKKEHPDEYWTHVTEGICDNSERPVTWKEHFLHCKQQIIVGPASSATELILAKEAMSSNPLVYVQVCPAIYA